MMELYTDLAKQNGVRPLDEQFALAMARLVGESNGLVLLYAAVLSRRLSEGHVCLDLRRFELKVAGYHEFPSRKSIIERLRCSPLVSDGRTLTPLVIDDADRLYLRRYWQHEQFVGTTLLGRAVEVDPVASPAFITKTLDGLFGSSGATKDLQRTAAEMAAHRRLTVVSGGPGTGKTTTVVKVLALLVAAAVEGGKPLPRIALMAPTGKAAARMGEAIKRAKPGLSCADEIKSAIPDEATTIHRALGTVRGSSTQFRYNESRPLEADIVLIDEASMVSVALMSRLLAAVPKSARLILLGDKDQLAAVEAGNVLSDICNAGAPLAKPAKAKAATGMWDCVTHLEVSHRYAPDSGIAELAKAVIAGDVERALAVLDSDRSDVKRQDLGNDGAMSVALTDTVRTSYRDYLVGNGVPAERLAAFDRFRILCAHRVGPHGAVDYNGQARAALARAGLVRATGDHYPGRPVMVTVNSYGTRLFNGDVGLELWDPTTESLRVYFTAPDGSVRELSPSRLPEHETVYAMSVHKSQGSEFDHVAVVLPDRGSKVVTRELLYTAVTRAKSSVVIHGSRAAIIDAIGTRVERSSGLRDALWG